MFLSEYEKQTPLNRTSRRWKKSTKRDWCGQKIVGPLQIDFNVFLEEI